MFNFRIQNLLSILMIVLGIVLMIFMILVESEPGGIPILLVLIGAGWYLITRLRSRSQQR